MTDRTPDELEREAEQVRAELSETTRQLRDKMSPGQMMDEALGYLKDGDAQKLLSNFKHQVRDNPLALALVGSGLAWLMAGSGVAASSSRAHTAATTAGASTSRSGAGIGSSIGDSLSGATAAVSGAAAAIGDSASGAGDMARDTMHDIQDRVGAGASSLGSSAVDLGQSARNTFFDALEREPLVIGALGVAVGAAIGAMIPTTRVEEKYLGKAGKSAVETAEGLVTEGIERAKDVAGDVYAAARDEADRQGLTGSDTPLADKVARVAKVAGEELSSAAHETFNSEPDDQSSDKREPWVPGHVREPGTF